MPDAMFVYILPPIDWNWGRVQNISDTVKQLSNDDARDVGDISLEDFIRDWGNAIAHRALVFKDYDSPVYSRVFWLPSEDGYEFRPAFVWKFHDNGTTVVVAPFELAWLNEYREKGDNPTYKL